MSVVDVLVRYLHRSGRDMVLVGTSTPLSDGKFELYLQRRAVDDDDQLMVSRLLVITCRDEEALSAALTEQLDYLLESGWHRHDWDPPPISVPVPDGDPLSALNDAMLLFAAVLDENED